MASGRFDADWVLMSMTMVVGLKGLPQLTRRFPMTVPMPAMSVDS